MHSTELGHRITAHHNSDYSGEVILDGVSERISWSLGGHPPASVTIPFECLEKLVLQKYISDATSILESIDPAAVSRFVEGMVKRSYARP